MSAQERNPRRLLTIQDLARELGCHFYAARALVESGEVPSVLVGNRRRVPQQALDAWLERAGERST